jgi:hypothetical protein
MKTLLMFGAVVIAIPAMTVSAAACSVTGQWGPYYIVCPALAPADDVRQPNQRHKKAHRSAPVQHVTKQEGPQQHDEKAFPVSIPPGLQQ